MQGAQTNRRRIFFLVATGVFLSTMDSSMINVALPSIMRSFAATLVTAELVVLIYLLTITVTLLVWGYLADRIGQGRIYLSGMLVFSLGSIFCSFAPTLILLILSRFIQAVGASMMMSAGPAIIKNIFPRQQLGQNLGMLGIATSAGLMFGPVVSGFLIRYSSWRAIFLVTVPISLSAACLGWSFFIRSSEGKKISAATQFDWYGSALWALLVSLPVLTVYYCNTTGPGEIMLMGVCIGLIARSFYFAEKRHPSPILPLFFFKENNNSVAIFTAAVSFIVLFMVLILIPFFMEYILEASTDTIGSVMMAVPVTLFILSPVSGRLYDKIGPVFLTAFGLLISSIAVILLCLLSPSSSPFDVAWRLALLGAGQSIFLSPNTASVLAAVDVRHTGIASGILATSRNIGMLMGVALAGMVFSTLFSHFTGGLDLKEYSGRQGPSFLLAFRYTLAAGAMLAFIGGFVSVQRRPKGKGRN
ncbi:MAG: MFS transporter [Desulfocapsaceae bacterium]|nr:MFS transporter [Desulfocapsaceae bacterium]